MYDYKLLYLKKYNYILITGFNRYYELSNCFLLYYVYSRISNIF